MYLALCSGLHSFRQGSTCLAVLWIPLEYITPMYTGLSPSLVGFPTPFFSSIHISYRGPNPNSRLVWAPPLSLAATYGIDFYLSFPLGTKMFQFPRSYFSIPMYSGWDDMIISCRVPPFGYLRINAYVQLPEAFRRYSRPSSPISAKAFTVRPY